VAATSTSPPFRGTTAGDIVNATPPGAAEPIGSDRDPVPPEAEADIFTVPGST
jgi:hypothetical protein